MASESKALVLLATGRTSRLQAGDTLIVGSGVSSDTGRSLAIRAKGGGVTVTAADGVSAGNDITFNPGSATDTGSPATLVPSGATYAAVAAGHQLIAVAAINGIPAGSASVSFDGTETTVAAFMAAIGAQAEFLVGEDPSGEIHLPPMFSGSIFSLLVDPSSDADVLASLGLTSGQTASGTDAPGGSIILATGSGVPAGQVQMQAEDTTFLRISSTWMDGHGAFLTTPDSKPIVLQTEALDENSAGGDIVLAPGAGLGNCQIAGSVTLRSGDHLNDSSGHRGGDVNIKGGDGHHGGSINITSGGGTGGNGGDITITASGAQSSRGGTIKQVLAQGVTSGYGEVRYIVDPNVGDQRTFLTVYPDVFYSPTPGANLSAGPLLRLSGDIIDIGAKVGDLTLSTDGDGTDAGQMIFTTQWASNTPGSIHFKPGISGGESTGGTVFFGVNDTFKVVTPYGITASYLTSTEGVTLVVGRDPLSATEEFRGGAQDVYVQAAETTPGGTANTTHLLGSPAKDDSTVALYPSTGATFAPVSPGLTLDVQISGFNYNIDFTGAENDLGTFSARIGAYLDRNGHFDADGIKTYDKGSTVWITVHGSTDPSVLASLGLTAGGPIFGTGPTSTDSGGLKIKTLPAVGSGTAGDILLDSAAAVNVNALGGVTLNPYTTVDIYQANGKYAHFDRQNYISGTFAAFVGTAGAMLQATSTAPRVDNNGNNVVLYPSPKTDVGGTDGVIEFWSAYGATPASVDATGLIINTAPGSWGASNAVTKSYADNLLSLEIDTSAVSVGAVVTQDAGTDNKVAVGDSSSATPVIGVATDATASGHVAFGGRASVQAAGAETFARGTPVYLANASGQVSGSIPGSGYRQRIGVVTATTTTAAPGDLVPIAILLTEPVGV